MAGSLQQSTEVMKAMQELVKLPDIAKTMQDMSREMMKAGIIEEMIEDTMESMEPEELEEEAQEEVDKVHYLKSFLNISYNLKILVIINPRLLPYEVPQTRSTLHNLIYYRQPKI